MSRLKSYIFQFGQVVTSLAVIIQEFTCCRLFTQHEWGKKVDAEIQQNQTDLKMFLRFKNNFFPRETLFLDRTIKEMFQAIRGFISLLKYHVGSVIKTNSTPSKISFFNLADHQAIIHTLRFSLGVSVILS